MGYSQFWYRPIEINENVYRSIEEDTKSLRELLKSKSIRVNFIEPLFNENVIPKEQNKGIVIEGSCETFLFPMVIPQSFKKIFVSMKDGRIFQFVKTNRGRYDLSVQMVLIIAKHHLKEQILVTSDGDERDWKMAKKLIQEHLGYGDDFNLDESPPFEEMDIEISWIKHELIEE